MSATTGFSATAGFSTGAAAGFSALGFGAFATMSLVAATSSSIERTLVASSNASSGNSSASEWNGIGLGSGVASVRSSPNPARGGAIWPIFGLLSLASAPTSGEGATLVGASLKIGGLVSDGGPPPPLAFSARILSSTAWLPSPSLSNRTPMPGATPGRAGSFSRVQTTVASPVMSGVASRSWNSNFICVPTGSGSFVRMKMPPWLTSTA